ncbi:MAG TPA: SIMPL domain-containing protein [Dehalococcoidia bacterium]|nr:SIMPL domain-containing protein [Dehalococcoidia bacterium]
MRSRGTRSSLLLTALLAAAVLLVGCGGGTTTITVDQGQQQTGISATGTGTVTVAPDIATLNIGIEVTGQSIAEARDEAATVATRLHDALSANRVDGNDIATRYFRIYARYAPLEPCPKSEIELVPRALPAPLVDPVPAPVPAPLSPSTSAATSEPSVATSSALAAPEPAPDTEDDESAAQAVPCALDLPRISGFTVTNQLVVTIRDIDSTSQVLDAAIEAGGDAARVDNVAFAVDEPEQYLDAVREEAMIDARQRAEELATLAGVELGGVRSISESSGSIFAARAFQDSALRAAPAPTSLSPGESELSLSVSIVYDIK